MKKGILIGLFVPLFLVYLSVYIYAYDVPPEINYQGYVTSGGSAYTGTGYFKFKLMNSAGTYTYWSNDGTHEDADTDAPDTAVSATVSSGVFNLILGDTDTTNMTALHKTDFTGENRLYLRIWFGTNATTFEQLSPDKELVSSAYSISSETFDSTTETTLTLDSDNTGSGGNCSIIANQGSGDDGIIRYNAAGTKWEYSSDGGTNYSDFGDITAIGDVTSGNVFTSSSTAGTSLWFYDAEGRGKLTIADLSTARTYTLPDATGYLVMDDAICSDIEGTGLSITSGTLNVGGLTNSEISSGDFDNITGIGTQAQDLNMGNIYSPVNVADIEFYDSDGNLTLIAADTSSAVTVTIPAVTGTLLQNIVEDSTPQLGGDLDCQANHVGFTQQAVTYNLTTTTVDWGAGNKAKLTFGAGNIGTLAFTNPPKPSNLMLVIQQDAATGGRTVTSWDSDIKWAGGTAPTLSTGASAIDIITFCFDGTNYYGVASLDFS